MCEASQFQYLLTKDDRARRILLNIVSQKDTNSKQNITKAANSAYRAHNIMPDIGIFRKIAKNANAEPLLTSQSVELPKISGK